MNSLNGTTCKCVFNKKSIAEFYNTLYCMQTSNKMMLLTFCIISIINILKNNFHIWQVELLFLFIIALYYFINKQKTINILIGKNDNMNSELDITFSDTKLIINNRILEKEETFKSDDIVNILETKNLLILQLDNKQFLPISKSTFDNCTAEYFLKLCVNNHLKLNIKNLNSTTRCIIYYNILLLIISICILVSFVINILIV